MWFPAIAAEPSITRTPVWRSSASAQPEKVYGPVIVKRSSTTFRAFRTSTIEFGWVMTGGAWITAPSGTDE